MSNGNTGRDTPSPVKRQLRQEAGFGCCKCGIPILQYHHIVEFSQEPHFRPDDMMVLCPIHHDQATKKAMPETEQREYKLRPYNIERGLANGPLKINQNYCAAQFGELIVVNEGPFLLIDGVEVFGMNVGEANIELSIKLFSERGELLVQIEKNEWVSGDPLPWDIQADWQLLTIRERHRKISLALNAKKIPMQVRGEFFSNGQRIWVTHLGLQFDGNPAKGTGDLELGMLAIVGGGLNLRADGALNLENARMVSWPDQRERLYKAKNVWNRLKNERA
jgi:hypothetical protein